MSDWFSLFDQGIRLSVRAKPGIARARDARLVDVGDGKQALEVAVAAAAQDGKANKAIVEALADLLGVKKKDVEIKSGQTSRLKIIEVQGDPAQLIATIKKELGLDHFPER